MDKTSGSTIYSSVDAAMGDAVSRDRRRLLLSRVAADRAPLDARQFNVEDVGLTSHDALRVGSSIWVAARWLDLRTSEQDIFLARFEQRSSLEIIDHCPDWPSALS